MLFIFFQCLTLGSSESFDCVCRCCISWKLISVSDGLGEEWLSVGIRVWSFLLVTWNCHASVFHMWVKYQSSNITLWAALLYRTPLTKRQIKIQTNWRGHAKTFSTCGYNCQSSNIAGWAVFLYIERCEKTKNKKNSEQLLFSQYIM